MSLIPPSPISSSYPDNVELLIQHMLENEKNLVTNRKSLEQRVKQDNATIYEILEKAKTIGSGNIQSDWTETDSLSDSYILNKPLLSTVATTGDYNDLINIPSLNAYWSSLGNSGTNPLVNFLGTTDNVGFNIRTNNINRFTVLGNGNVGLNNSNPPNLFTVGTTTNSFGTAIANFGLDVNAETSIFISNSNSGNTAKAIIRTFGAGGRSSLIGDISPNHTSTQIDQAGNFSIDVNAINGHDLSIITAATISKIKFYVGGRDSINRIQTIYPKSITISNVDQSEIDSSLLTLTSTDKGFLPPRITTIEKNAISLPAEGLLLYDKTIKKLSLYTNEWKEISDVTSEQIENTSIINAIIFG